MSVPRRELAPGYSVSRLIHGGWQLSEGHRPGARIDRRASVDELLRLVDAGVTTFDCADIYTGVEELYGDLLAACRRRGTAPPEVHTKLVPDLEDLPGLERRQVRALVDRSLARLRSERLDLVQLHWWDTSIPGWIDAAGWLDELRQEGKIRHLGVTNFDAGTVAQILDAGVPLVSQQVQYSVLDRRPERSLARLAARRRVALLAYGTLAGGFLTARWRGFAGPPGRPANRSLVKYGLLIRDGGGWTAFQGVLEALAEVARRHGVSPANVAVRWVLDRPGVAAAIVGGRDASHLAANLTTLALELDADDEVRIADALAAFPGLPGDVYHLERDREGAHGSIMRYDLNRSRETPARPTLEIP